eukprot:gene6100-2308_t
MSEASKEQLRAAFAVFDTDGSGTLSAAELKAVLLRPVNGVPSELTAEHVDHIVQQYDANGDSVLQLSEFVEAWSALHTSDGVGDALVDAVGDAQEEAEAMAVRMLERLEAADFVAPLPIKPHNERVGSGERGVSLWCLRALRTFFGVRGALGKSMGVVCKEEGCPFSVCALTTSTGLSLAESVVHYAEEEGFLGVNRLIGHSSSFFSYSWTGTTLSDMLDALDGIIGRLEAEPGSETKFVWVDMFCASQNLLA